MVSSPYNFYIILILLILKTWVRVPTGSNQRL